MERIEELFPRYDESGKLIIKAAYDIAAETLSTHQRSNGDPFIEHPLAVARIACDEIGLSAECIAAVFLHEATRFFPETAIPKGMFGQDVLTMVVFPVITVKRRFVRRAMLLIMMIFVHVQKKEKHQYVVRMPVSVVQKEKHQNVL